MESVDSLHKPPIQRINGSIINGLTKNQLQELCKEVTGQINRYDYYIRLQLEDTIKNYNLCVALCEEKLDLLSIYKNYKKALATHSSEKEDQEEIDLEIINDILDVVYETIIIEKNNHDETVLTTLSAEVKKDREMVSERDPHE